MIAEGRFREDLYCRLSVMEIAIAPLARFLLAKHLPKSSKKISGFTDEVMEFLRNYSFPGNVRELENIIERAIILEKGNRIAPESLPRAIRMLQIDTIDPEKILPIDDFIKEYAEKMVKLLGCNRSKAYEAPRGIDSAGYSSE